MTQPRIVIVCSPKPDNTKSDRLAEEWVRQFTGWDIETDVWLQCAGGELTPDVEPVDGVWRFITIYGERIYEITCAEARRCLQAWEMGDEDSPVVPERLKQEERT